MSTWSASPSATTTPHANVAGLIYVELSSSPVEEYRVLTRVELWGVDGRLGQLHGVVVDSLREAVRYFVLQTRDGLRALPADEAFVHPIGVILLDVWLAWLPYVPALDDVLSKTAQATLPN